MLSTFRGCTPGAFQSGVVAFAMAAILVHGASPRSAAAQGNIRARGLTSASAPISANTLIAYGDSITLGCCAQAAETDWPAQVGKLWTSALTTYNEGIGAQTAAEIAVRMNAYAGQTQQTVPAAFSIPASGTVSITFQPGYNPCYEAGVQGPRAGAVQLTFTVGGTNYTGTCADGGSRDVGTFTPSSYPASPVPIPAGSAFTAGMLDASNNPIVITSTSCVAIQARNITTVAQTEADIVAMVNTASAITPCWSVMNLPNSEIASEWVDGQEYISVILPLNNWILQSFGTHAIDIRKQLLNHYDPANTLDQQDYANGVPPASLRSGISAGTKLSSAISDAATCAFSTSPALAAPSWGGDVAQIDSEFILISGGSNGNYTCTRGYGGSTAAVHATGAAVNEIDWLHPGVNGLTAQNPNCEGGGGYRCIADLYVSWMTNELASPVSPSTTSLTANASSVAVGNPVTLTATIAGAWPRGQVTFTANGATLGQATVSNGAAALQTSFPAAGTYSITAAYSGDADNGPSTSDAVSVVVTGPSYTLSANATAQTVTAGQSAQFTITLTPSDGYSAATSFACSGLPSKAGCTFNPSSVTPNGNPVSTTLTITTTAASAMLNGQPGRSPWAPAGSLVLTCAIGSFLGRRRTRNWRTLLRALSCVLLMVCVALVANGCGGGGNTVSQSQSNPGTPAGSYSVTVNASGAMAQSINLTLVVQ